MLVRQVPQGRQGMMVQQVQLEQQEMWDPLDQRGRPGPRGQVVRQDQPVQPAIQDQRGPQERPVTVVRRDLQERLEM